MNFKIEVKRDHRNGPSSFIHSNMSGFCDDASDARYREEWHRSTDRDNIKTALSIWESSPTLESTMNVDPTQIRLKAQFLNCIPSYYRTRARSPVRGRDTMYEIRVDDQTKSNFMYLMYCWGQRLDAPGIAKQILENCGTGCLLEHIFKYRMDRRLQGQLIMYVGAFYDDISPLTECYQEPRIQISEYYTI